MLGTIYVDEFEARGAAIAFETHKGEFSVNAVTRRFAEAEMRRKATLARLPRKTPGAEPPNRLDVVVVAARALTGGAGTCDPVVVTVRCRGETRRTSTVMKNVDPRWDEELTPIRLKDPSTVIHVMVHDEELFLHNKLLGQWIITAKWLAMDPRACHAYDVERAGPGVLEGWFPLSDAAWERRGAVGFVKLKLKWSYDDAGPFKDWNPLLYTGAAPKKKSVFPVIPTTPRPSEARDDDDDDRVASARLTALEQLTAQSDETNLKLGSTRNVRAMLETFPFWFAVRAVAVTGVDFWLKDLFAGTTGTGERGSQRDARGVFVPRIYASDRAALRPPAGDAGLTLWRVAYNFVVKAAAPEVVNMTSVRHQAIGQILAGFFARTGATAPKRGGSVATLHEARSVEAPPDARQRGKIGRQLRMKFNKDKSKLVTRDTRDVNREAALAGAEDDAGAGRPSAATGRRTAWS
ncbi:hypothetical protein JL722_3038 [Aureococcus anophagefferens]|nr:hypothetical protein JL722_3038 [Aureococcus anophagefferens]